MNPSSGTTKRRPSTDDWLPLAKTAGSPGELPTGEAFRCEWIDFERGIHLAGFGSGLKHSIGRGQMLGEVTADLKRVREQHQKRLHGRGAARRPDEIALAK